MSIIKQLKNEGVLALYHDYRSGSIIDFSGNSNDGSFQGNSRLNNTALNNIGTGDYISISGNSDFSSSTMSLIFLVDDPSNNEETYQYLSGRSAITESVYYRTDTNKLGFTNGTQYESSAITETIKSVVFNLSDSSAVDFYVNGVFNSSSAGSPSITDSSNDFYVGGDGTYWYESNIKCALVVSRNLTASEISQIIGELENTKFNKNSKINIVEELSEPPNISDVLSWTLNDIGFESGRALDGGVYRNHTQLVESFCVKGNATTAYIDHGVINTCSTGSQDWTWEGCIDPTGMLNQEVIASEYDTAGNKRGWALRINGNAGATGVTFQVGKSDGTFLNAYNLDGAISVGDCVKITFEDNGANGLITYYLNDVLQDTAAVAGQNTLYSNGANYATFCLFIGGVASSFGAAKLWDQKVYNGASLQLQTPYQGSFYDISGNGNHGTAIDTIWSTQDKYHYNFNEGCDIYLDDATSSIYTYVPYIDNIPIVSSVSGYTKQSLHYPGNWHNGCETKLIVGATDFDGTGWNVDSDIKTADTNEILHDSGTGYGKSLGYSDLQSAFTGNYLFCNVDIENQYKNLVMYNAPQDVSIIDDIHDANIKSYNKKGLFFSYGILANVDTITTNFIENTPFTINVGSFKIDTDSYDSYDIKILECVANGNCSMPMQNTYGEWSFYFKKGASNTINVMYIASVDGRDNATGQDGYLLQLGPTEKLIIYKITNGANAGTLLETDTNQFNSFNYNKLTISRTVLGVTTVYINDIAVTAASGSNPYTDNTHTISKFMNFNIDSGDKIILADKKGKYNFYLSD